MIRLHDLQSKSFTFDARALATTIQWLRPCDAIGQALAALVAVVWLRISVPVVPLAAGITALILATPVTFWRLSKPWPVGETEPLRVLRRLLIGSRAAGMRRKHFRNRSTPGHAPAYAAVKARQASGTRA